MALIENPIVQLQVIHAIKFAESVEGGIGHDIIQKGKTDYPPREYYRY